MAPSCATWAVAAGHIVSLPSASRGQTAKKREQRRRQTAKSGERGEGRTRQTAKMDVEAHGKDGGGGEGRRRQTAKMDGEADGKY